MEQQPEYKGFLIEPTIKTLLDKQERAIGWTVEAMLWEGAKCRTVKSDMIAPTKEEASSRSYELGRQAIDGAVTAIGG
jgi:hypothetical protein